MHDVAVALNKIKAELNSIFYERQDAIEAIMLAILTGEHIFLLGPPGTGKSFLVRACIEAVTNARYFECAMSKTRTDDAVLGPLDIQELRATGARHRKNKGYATDAEYVFIDEIGKMSSVLGHDMLALLNERLMHEVNGGRSAHKVPLRTAFAASNEIPTDESDDAAALWDRLLFRVVVDYIKDDKNFLALMTSDMPPLTNTVAFADLEKVIDVEVPAVTLSKDAAKAILHLRKELAKEHIYPSDRRWRQSYKALKAAAFLDGRDQVFDEDLAALRFTLWDTIPQIEKIEKLTSSASNPFVEKVMKARKQLKEIKDGIQSRKDKNVVEKSAYAQEANGKLAAVRADLDALLKSANGRNIPKFKEVSDLHRDTIKFMYMTCFDQEEELAEIAIRNKLGLGDGTQGSQS